MKNWNIKEIQNRIAEVLPPNKVIPRHNNQGHFYEVTENEHPIYPSVTGKLQVLKDQGLMNYKMNRAIEYVFAHYKEFNDSNIMEQLDIASRVSQDILEDAGDIGTRIHDLREKIFAEWIRTGEKPADFLAFIPPEEVDIRVTSGLRALRKFVDERDYIPVACELLVYSHEYKVAGTLDDLGLMREVIREGDPTCTHEIILSPNGVARCVKCDRKYRYEFVLMDIKTSNQLKDHYFFQVCLYWRMFWKLMGINFKPEKCIIVKLSKEDGTYKIEDLKEPAKLSQYAVHMLKTNEGVDFIKSLRKDNQRVVAPLLKL